MNIGAGRFANPVLFDLVQDFFNPLNQLAPGVYTEQDLRGLGLSNQIFITQQNWQYSDQTNDYAERVYIWNSVAFEIDDRARFVVTPTGERYIDEFAIIPLDMDPENFDFRSYDPVATAGNNLVLTPNIDPFFIGRTVDIGFTGVRDWTSYSFSDFQADAASVVLPNILLGFTLYSQMMQIVDDMWDSGVSQYLDEQDRVVIFGTNSDDVLFQEMGEINIKLRNYIDNGVSIIAGKGDDVLGGSDAGDYLDGGEGNDEIHFTLGPQDTADDVALGGAGNDQIYLGGGKDIASGGDGDDTFYLSGQAPARMAQSSEAGMTFIWGGDGADTYDIQGGARVLVVHAPKVTDDIMKNLDVGALTAEIQAAFPDSSFEYVIINPDEQDKFVVGETELAQAGTEGYGLTTFDSHFLYEFDSWISDPGESFGWQLWTSTGMRGIARTDVFLTFDFLEGEDQEADAWLGMSGNYAQFTVGADGSYLDLTGFTTGTAGITFQGNALDWWQQILQVDYALVPGYGTFAEFDYVNNHVYYTPISPELGDEINEEIFLEEGNMLKPDGFDSAAGININLEDFLLDLEEEGTGGDDGFGGAPPEQVMNGGSGNDTVDYSPSDGGVGVNLATGIGAGGYAEGDTYENIENVIGSGFADAITGSSADNSISAGLGDDVIVGSAGTDAVDGGAGDDTFEVTGDPSTFAVSVQDGTKIKVVGASGVSVLSSVESLVIHNTGQTDVVVDLESLIDAAAIKGTPQAETITGTSQADLILGFGGNDTIFGGGGRDSINAGDGDDVIFVTDGIGEVTGGSGSDTVIINGKSDAFEAAYVDASTIEVRSANGSLLVTAAEWVVFDDPNSTNDASINVTSFLAERAPIVADGTAENDVLNGAAGNDELYGKDGHDQIFAGEGDDLVLAGAGDDVIFAHAGDKVIDGADGDDTVIFDYDRDSVQIFALDWEKISVVGPSGTSVLTNVEYVVFEPPTGPEVAINVADYVGEYLPFEYVGDDTDELIEGYAGSDSIDAAGGNDQILAGAGDDIIWAGTGDDVIFGDEGTDFVDGEEGSDTIIFAGRLTEYTVSVLDDNTIAVEKDDSISVVRNVEWLVFDAPEGETDDSINIVTFIAQNGELQDSEDSSAASIAAEDPRNTERYAGSPAPASAEIIAFPNPASPDYRQADGSVSSEIDGSSRASVSETAADIISLQDFAVSLQQDDHGSDLWFEPEPIGAII